MGKSLVQSAGAEGEEQPHRVWEDLVRRGEGYALAGASQQAEALLAEAWALARRASSHLRDRIAWDLALLRLHHRDYQGAAVWFSRVAQPPTIQGHLWPSQRQLLVELCQRLKEVPHGTGATARLGAAPPTAALPELVITNLGRFAMARDGTPLPVCRARKAIALLRYLLSRSHRTAHREELMDVLWPDARPQEAAHSLHVAISTLRRYLDLKEESYLLFVGGHYFFNPDAHLEDDSLRFVHLSDEADKLWRSGDGARAGETYAQAVAAYAGDYFVDSQDLPWALAERERLLARYLLALERLGQLLVAQGRFDTAAECYQRLVERDNYREDSHGQLIRCYLHLGRRSDALRQYQSCANALANDLGLDPMPEMQQLYLEIIGMQQKTV